MFVTDDIISSMKNSNERTCHRQKAEGTTMKKFGFASIVASGLAAAVLGLAAPAQAGLSHNIWVNQNGPSVTVPVPHVDTSVHQSR
jgi:hypothetical protein